MWTFLGITGLIAGLVLIIIALRGRRIGDHSYCKNCGFDQFGLLPANENCPECGADVIGPDAVQIGVRRVRRWLLSFGLILLLVFGLLTANITFDLASQVNWLQYKPFTWVLHAAAANKSDLEELKRRLNDDQLDANQIDRVLAATLDVQADRTQPWPQGWQILLDDFLKVGPLTPEQLQRYFRQGLDIKLKVKPVIRRGQSATFDLDSQFDRLTAATRYTQHRRWANEVLFHDVAIFPTSSFISGEIKELQVGYSSGHTAELKLRGLENVPLGPTQITTTFNYDLTLTAPGRSQSIKLKIPMIIPIRLAGPDQIVDTFESDPAFKKAMRQAITRARVDTSSGKTNVWVRVENPPAALAMAVILRQDGKEQRVGTMHVDALATPQWRKVPNFSGLKPTGVVDIVLRPSQKALDLTLKMGSYWGDTIVLPGIKVNEPYTPPFNYDKLLAAAMEKAVTIDQVLVDDGKHIRWNAHFNADGPPCRIAFYASLLLNGKKVSIQVPLRGPANAPFGHSSSYLKLPDPQAKTIDVLLVPDRDWESSSTDPTPPWGYSLLFKDVPLPRKSKGELPAGPFYPKAILERAE